MPANLIVSSSPSISQTFPSMLTGQLRELPQVRYVNISAFPEQARNIARQLLQYGHVHKVNLYDKTGVISLEEKVAFKRWLMANRNNDGFTYINNQGGCVRVGNIAVGIKRDNRWSGQAHWDVYLSLPKREVAG